MRLSPSGIQSYLHCGESFRRAVLEKEREPSSLPALRGKAVHKSAEINYIQKIVTQENLPQDVVQDVARDYTVQEAKSGDLSIPEEYSGKPKSQVVGSLVDESVRLAGLYHYAVGANTMPKRVEEKIELALPGGITLVQILDVQDEYGVIADIKTSSRKKNQTEADRSIQLTMQYLAAKVLDNGEEPPYVRLDVLINNRKPDLQQLISTRSMSDVETLANVVSAVSSGINAGIFLPAAASMSWKCSPTYCGFYSSCKYVRR